MRFYADLHVRPGRSRLERNTTDLDQWVLVAAVKGVAVLGTGYFLFSLASKPSYAIVASGISASEGGEIAKSLESAGITYELRDGDWETEREGLGDLVLKSLETYAPGISDLVTARQVLTPPDLEKEYGITGGHPLHAHRRLLPAAHRLRPADALGEGSADARRGRVRGGRMNDLR